MSSLLPDSSRHTYHTGVLAILIESAVPLLVPGLALTIVVGITRSEKPDLLPKEIANYVFSAFYYPFVVCQQRFVFCCHL